MKKHGLVYSMVVLLAWLLPACTADDDLAPAVKPAEGLTISLETPGVLSRATIAGNDALNENTISQAQLLIFNSKGERTPDGYRSFEFTDGKTEAVIATGNWKNNIQLFDKGAGAAYDIYVVANAHEGSTSLQNVETLDDLLSAVDKDADIWKLEGANIGTGTVDYTDKRFAMSGVSSGFVPNEKEDEYTISVPMERLAAKVEVNITFSDEFKAKFKPTGFYSSLRNYATRGLWRSDKEVNLKNTDRGIAGNRANDPMVAAPEKNYEECTAKLVLYTYPTDWGGDVLQETFVLLNMPGNYTEQEGAQPESNYYKIPVRLGDAAAHQLNRNTIYRVDVTIDRMGQPQLDVPVELTPKKYEVIQWTEVTIDVDNGDLNYLELLKEEIIMKNIDESLEQYFTSSSPVTASITEVYYYDKYGAKQTILPRNYERYGISVDPAAGNFGNVTINSDVPTNNGIRYIKVTVTNEQGLSKEFTVKQYPLEYIVTVPGWYSYRTDFGSTYEEKGTRKVSNDYFSSKVYYEGDGRNDEGIYTYTWPRYGSGPSLGTYSGSQSNNNMYFVRITKTSDKYVLSVPAMDKDGYTESSPENNQLVAPAFMIASQLGTVYPQRFNDAKEHCKQYAEKSIAGEVYEDWRLPTEAELEIIDRYQNTNGSVIDEVLARRYYWAASGTAYVTMNGDRGSASNAYIRCIRTVKANEPIVEDKE